MRWKANPVLKPQVDTSLSLESSVRFQWPFVADEWPFFYWWSIQKMSESPDQTLAEQPQEQSGQRPPCPTPASLLKAVSDFHSRAEVRVIQTSHYRTTCRILGEGPALVLSPGIASTYQGFALLLNKLSEQFRTIIYDYPGD